MVERLAVAGLLIGLAPDLVSRRQIFLQGLLVGTIALLPLASLVVLFCSRTLPRVRVWILRGRERSWRAGALPDLLLALRLEAEDGAGVVQSLVALDPEAFPHLGPALRRFQEELQDTFDVRSSLRTLQEELNFPEGERLVDALLSGESLGVPLRQTLVNQESLARNARLQVVRQRSGYIPYVLTTLTGLLFINGAILLGYPHLVHLLSNLSSVSWSGI